MKTISYCGKDYEVVYTDSVTCKGCAFHERRCCPKGSLGSITTLCFEFGSHVIFKPVKL